MKLSFEWMTEYIDLPESSQKIGELLTRHVAEVECVEAITDDTLITIDNKALTHRPDLFCHIGFARELSAVLKRPLKLKALQECKEESRLPYTVSVREPTLCRRFMAVMLDHITIGPSPEWIKKRLIAVGIRPINNVVDITNYVMLEYGQPLHAFDYHKLNGATMIVRFAKAGETIQTLDGKFHELTKAMLVIADEKKAQDVAGVMGGSETEITEATTAIALTAANFDPVVIRRTAQALNMRTEASTRNEKNLPQIFPEFGFWRALELLKQHAGARIASVIHDIRSRGEMELRPITLSISMARAFIGMDIAGSEIQEILKRLGCTVVSSRDDHFEVTPPHYRADLLIAEDLIEEIARIYGYERIPSVPLRVAAEPQPQEIEWRIGQRLMDWLIEAGAYEIFSYSFYSEKYAEQNGLETKKHLRLVNPLNTDQQLLRQTLHINMLNAAEANVRRGDNHCTLAEYGHVYLQQREQKRVAFLVAGDTDRVFAQAKGLFEYLMQKANIEAVSTVTDPSTLIFAVDGETIGTLSFYPRERFIAACAEVFLEPLAKRWNEGVTVQSPSAYPGIELDISIAVAETIPWKEISDTITATTDTLLQNLIVFDVYRGKGVNKGQKALGIRMMLGATDRTLTMDEAEKMRHTIVEELKKRYQAIHRY